MLILQLMAFHCNDFSKFPVKLARHGKGLLSPNCGPSKLVNQSHESGDKYLILNKYDSDLVSAVVFPYTSAVLNSLAEELGLDFDDKALELRVKELGIKHLSGEKFKLNIGEFLLSTKWRNNNDSLAYLVVTDSRGRGETKGVALVVPPSLGYDWLSEGYEF